MGCFICGQDNPAVLQEHHVVPQRFGGSDADENLTTLCASCHQAVEKMYNKRFYTELGVEGDDSKESAKTIAKTALEQTLNDRETLVEDYNTSYSEVNNREMGTGEWVGYHVGFIHAYENVIRTLDGYFDTGDLEELREEVESEEEPQEIEVESPE